MRKSEKSLSDTREIYLKILLINRFLLHYLIAQSIQPVIPTAVIPTVQ